MIGGAGRAIKGRQVATNWGDKVGNGEAGPVVSCDGTQAENRLMGAEHAVGFEDLMMAIMENSPSSVTFDWGKFQCVGQF